MKLGADTRLDPEELDALSFEALWRVRPPSTVYVQTGYVGVVLAELRGSGKTMEGQRSVDMFLERAERAEVLLMPILGYDEREEKIGKARGKHWTLLVAERSTEGGVERARKERELYDSIEAGVTGGDGQKKQCPNCKGSRCPELFLL